MRDGIPVLLLDEARHRTGSAHDRRPELAEEVLDDLELLRARDPRGLLPAVAGAGAQVRETARLTDEAGLGRVTEGGRPRGLVIVARREGAVAGSVLRALLGPSSPVTVDVVPGPTLPVWTGPSDIAVVATRTGAGRYAVTPAYEAARRGVVAARHRRRGRAAARRLLRRRGRPYVPLPALAGAAHDAVVAAHPAAAAGHRARACCPRAPPTREAIAAALDEVAGECGPAQESFVNPAKTLALELLDALPVIAAEGPLAGAAAARVADQLATLAGLPVAGFRLPDQRVAPARCSAGRWRPAGGADDFFRDRAEDDRAGGCGCSPSATPTPAGTTARGSGSRGRRPRRWTRCCATAAAHNVPVSGLAEHGEPDAVRPAAAAGPAARRRRLQRRLPRAGAGQREGAPRMTDADAGTEPADGGHGERARRHHGDHRRAGGQPRHRDREVRRLRGHRRLVDAGRGDPLARRLRQPGAAADRRPPGRSARRPRSTRSATAATATSTASSSRSCCSASVACSPSTRACTSCSTPRRSTSPAWAIGVLVVAIVAGGLLAAHRDQGDRRGQAAARRATGAFIRRARAPGAAGRAAGGHRRRCSAWSSPCSASGWPRSPATASTTGWARSRSACCWSSSRSILAMETKSLLLGESATPEDQRQDRRRAGGRRRRSRSSTCGRMHLGPDELLVAAKIAVAARRHGGGDRPGHRRRRARGSARPSRSPGSSTWSPTCGARPPRRPSARDARGLTGRRRDRVSAGRPPVPRAAGQWRA